MSLLIPTRSTRPSEVHYTEYILTENEPDEGPVSPPKPPEGPQPDQ